MITIRISEKASDICMKAIKAAAALYDGDMGPAFEILKDGFRKPAKFDGRSIRKLNSYLQTLNPKSNAHILELLNKIGDSLNGEKDITYDDMLLICSCFTVIQNIWLGKWSYLALVSNNTALWFDIDKQKELDTIVNRITDVYRHKGYDRYSYSILSSDLKDEIRILYGFQLSYRYEKYGCDNLMLEALKNSLGNDVPEFILPYKKTIVFKSNEEIEKFTLEWMKTHNRKHEMLYQEDIREIYHEEEGYYFPIEHSVNHLVQQGDIVHIKQNDYFVVETKNIFHKL